MNQSDILLLITNLRSSGFKLSVLSGKLQCRSAKDIRLSDEQKTILKKHKDAIIDFLQNEKLQNLILKANRNSPLLLSFSQQRLWFLDRYDEANSCTYNLPLVISLGGPLNIAAFDYALNYLVARHESLRTFFNVGVDGSPVQIIKSAMPVILKAEDVLEEDLFAILHKEIRQPFNLSQYPLFRARLLKVSASKYIFSFVHHHIISDGWSGQILLRELSKLYNAKISGSNFELSALSLQYVDYAQWQRNFLRGNILENKLKYWIAKLQGYSTLQLPIDFQRPLVKKNNGKTYRFTINPGLCEQLNKLVHMLGGTLVLPNEEDQRNPAAWLNLINNEQITLWNSVPALMQMLVEYAVGRQTSGNVIRNVFRSLRLVLLSGDWIPLDLPGRIWRLMGDGVEIISLGGATEGAIWSILYPIKSVDKGWKSIPYGKPMCNQKFYILDKYLKPVPIGVKGELCIGGIGVANGYWRDEKKTTEKFVYYAEAQERIYKTGDIGRYLEDGTIEFLGRVDNQVKVRGFRIELGEIESVFGLIPGIGAHVVMVCDINGQKNLAAFYVVKYESLQEEEIKKFMKQYLPEYMIPVVFVSMQEMPLTSNGKINREALVRQFAHNKVKQVIEPGTQEEIILDKIWSKILNRNNISTNDNFFHLGGNSLLAIQMLNQVVTEFNCDVPVKVIFENPTIGDLAICIKEKSKLLRNIKSNGIREINRPALLPLSFAQQRLWFLYQYEGKNSSHYNIPIAIRLQGDLDISVLEKSINMLIARHESLRTVFKDISGIPRQEIFEQYDIQLNVESISENDLCAILSQEAIWVFDLQNGPLWRIRLLRLGEKQHVLIFNQHHIISDGWSVGILLRELGCLYCASITQTPASLPELSIQYADFACWQNDTVQEKELCKKIDYWKNQLEGISALNLPTDFPRPAIKTFSGSVYRFEIDRDVTNAVKLLIQQTNTTYFIFLLTIFNILLCRYSQQNDIVVGTPVANRCNIELENVVGFFVNTLALRTKLVKDFTFFTLLEQVKQVCVNAYSNQGVPFEKLVDILHVRRDVSRDPIFQVMFVFEDMVTPLTLELPNIKTTLLDIEYNVAKFDLTFSVRSKEEAIGISIEYNTDLYRNSTIENISRHFIVLLQEIIKNPTLSIGCYDILTCEEKQKILIDWNKTDSNYPEIKTLHKLFEEQVKRTPNNIAVVFEGKELSYQELNGRANQLARYLRNQYKQLTQHDLNPDTLIALCLDRSFEMVISILGVLKAGGTYVPIDSSYPKERMCYILEDTGTNVVITQKNLQEQLEDTRWGKQSKENRTIKIIVIDSEQMKCELKILSTNNLGKISQATDLAYVIYTSGTTGIPKGVMVEHKSAVNTVVSLYNIYEFSKGGKITAFTSYNFDVSVSEIFVALTKGVELHLLSEKMRNDLLLLSEYVKNNNINYIYLPPAVLSVFPKLEYGALQGIIYAGEPCDQEVGKYWSSKYRLYNYYGPTEATIYATGEQILGGGTNLIGFPISNVKCYILDENILPVPIGVIGELCIGGVGLARGYLNQEKLTAERFIANPFATEADKIKGYTRLYKTGDLVRWLPNGKIEYIGRNDFQVKIRGFRIELGEIEAQLTKIPAINQCVVTVYESAKQEGFSKKQIVAYYVSKEAIDQEKLRLRLKKVLPEYMMPVFFIKLDKLPLLVSGKVDRQALPAPDVNVLILAQYIAPRNEVEQALAKVWREVLHLDHIGVNDNFFMVGGDSILSIQVVAKVRHRGIYITPRHIFESPTIAELALKATSIGQVKSEQGLVEGAFALTPIQQWFFEQHYEYPHYWNQSQVIIVPELNFERLTEALQKLVWQHDALRLRYNKKTENIIQHYQSHCLKIEIQQYDLSQIVNQDEAVANKCGKWQSELNFENGNVMAVGVITGHSDGRARLFIAIHHLMVDGVSWRILISDLYNLYMGRDLLPKTSSFKAWREALVEYAQQASTISHLEYWEKIAAFEQCNLPYDDEAIEDYKTNVISIKLDRLSTGKLIKECGKAYSTQINDLLLTAFALALASWLKRDNVVFNLEGHGREDCVPKVDVSRTVGWFTSIFPVKLTLPKENSLGAVIKAVKEQLRSIPDKGLSYGVLRYCHPDAEVRSKLECQPLPRISFNYLGQFDSSASNDWDVSGENSGCSIDIRNHPANHLDVNGWIVDKQLHFSLIYSPRFKEPTIEKLAQQFRSNLLMVIEHCRSKHVTEYTPSDFPLAKIQQADLDQIVKSYPGIVKLYPLSPLQEGLLFHVLHSPDSDQYIVQIVWEHKGPLSEPALRQSWEQLIGLHDILRTGFIWDKGEQALQYVVNIADLPWIRYDISAFNLERQNKEIERIRCEDRLQPYDLRRPCAMRLYLIKQNGEQYTFIWSSHHILFDGWCLPILMRQLCENYQAIIDGGQVLPRIVNQYDQFIGWLQQQDNIEARNYWQNKLREIKAPTEIGVKKSGIILEPNRTIINYGQQTLCFTKEKTQCLQQFSRSQQITINTLLQFAYGKILQTYSGEAYTVFGTTISGRAHALPHIEQMVGLFINTLPMIIEWLVPKSVSEKLKEIHQAVQELNQYSYISLSEVQRLSAVKQGGLFNSILVFENYPVGEKQNNGGLNIEQIRGFEKTNYPLSIKHTKLYSG